MKRSPQFSSGEPLDEQAYASRVEYEAEWIRKTKEWIERLRAELRRIQGEIKEMGLEASHNGRIWRLTSPLF
jgi:uncharacterized protein (UPF0335 family)